MKHIIAAALLLTTINLQAQNKYLLDSFFLTDILTNSLLSVTYYEYNSDCELTTINSGTSFSTYHYPTDSTRQRLIYKTDNPGVIFQEWIDLLDINGRLKSRTKFQGGKDDEKFISTDSTSWSEIGELYYQRRYSYTNGVAILDKRIDGYLNADQQIDSIFTLEYTTEDGTLKTDRSVYNIYGSNKEIQYNISHTALPFPRIDTTSYHYTNNELSSDLRKYYSAGELEGCYLREYNNSDQQERILSSFSVNCTDYEPQSRSTTWLSSNDLFRADSIIVQTLSTGEDSTFLINTHDVDFSDNQAILRTNIDKSYLAGKLTKDRERLYFYHLVVSPDAISNVPLATFHVFPNPVQLHSKFSIKSDTEFDRVDIYTVDGTLENRFLTSVKSANVVDSPPNAGMYFIRLFKEERPVSVMKQLVVLD